MGIFLYFRKYIDSAIFHKIPLWAFGRVPGNLGAFGRIFRQLFHLTIATNILAPARGTKKSREYRSSFRWIGL